MEVHAEDAQGVITISGPPPSAIKVRFVNSKPALLPPSAQGTSKIIPHLGLKESKRACLSHSPFSWDDG